MAGSPPARASIPAPPDAGRCGTPWGPAWFEPIPGRSGLWLEAEAGVGVPLIARAALVVAGALDDEARRSELVRTLAERHEEIRLLYAISDILGRTTRLDEAARTIVQEVALVVGARRASIMVHDPAAGLLRTVAAAGFEAGPDEAVRVDDAASVAARVFRERAALAYEPPDAETVPRGTYRGVAFLSVPITYAAPGQPPRCVGVINLTDRVGGDRFTPANRQLVGAIASQIGAALENARLAERERAEQRLRRELEIAHDLQLALLPSPVALRGDADVAVRCVPVEEIGGDFYTFARLGQGRVGVMLGDVASHGFASALVMALALSAAGIHAAAARSPEETLAALQESVQDELARTEMYLTVFYGMFDPATRTLHFSNAGHPYAWRIMPNGLCGRLGATAPPMGLADGVPLGAAEVSWDPEDLLLLCTDGLLDAPSREGVPFGEERLLRAALAARDGGVGTVLDGVLSAVAAWSPTATDDRTLLVMKFGAGA